MARQPLAELGLAKPRQESARLVADGLRRPRPGPLMVALGAVRQAARLEAVLRAPTSAKLALTASRARAESVLGHLLRPSVRQYH